MEITEQEMKRCIKMLKSFCEAHMKEADDYGVKKLYCNCPFVKADKKFGVRWCGLTTGFDAKDWFHYPVIPKKWEVVEE